MRLENQNTLVPPCDGEVNWEWTVRIHRRSARCLPALQKEEEKLLLILHLPTNWLWTQDGENEAEVLGRRLNHEKPWTFFAWHSAQKARSFEVAFLPSRET